MVTDTLKNAKLYYALGDGIKKGLKYLEETDFSKMPKGTHLLDGKDLYVMLNSYMTKKTDEAKPESHKNYIDIQYMYKGAEYMGYASLENQQAAEPYNPEKDVIFYNCGTSFMKYNEGSFVIFFPDDIHAPGVASESISEVIKVVVKVRIKSA